LSPLAPKLVSTSIVVVHISCGSSSIWNVKPSSSNAHRFDDVITVSRLNDSRWYASTRALVSTRWANVPRLGTASLTSKRSAKSQAASIRMVRSTRACSWLINVNCSWKPLPTMRWRMTDSFESMYTVPVPGTRKKRVS